MFGICERTVTRIMARAQKSLSNGVLDVSNRKVLTGRKPKYTVETLKEKLASVPPKKRKTIRDSAFALGISPSTFFRYIHVKKFSNLAQ
jgi:hypothetical protein